MEKYSTQFCQILTFISLLLVGLYEKISAEELKTTSFFHRHYDCIPILTHNGVVVNTTHLPDGHHLGDITLTFVAFGRQLTVDLSLNRHLFPKSYVVRVFHVNGTGVESNGTKQAPENCYYHGEVRGQPRSEAAISTCRGTISGYITDRRDTYHIQPLRGRMHRIYRNSDQRRLPFKCGTVGHDNRLHSHSQVINRYKRRSIRSAQPSESIESSYIHPPHRKSIRAPYDSNKNTRYVELYLVNDYRTYERHGKSMEIVIKRSQDIANIVSGLYRQLNIYVALVGVEVWGAGDLITISKSADSTMENFLRYRKERINPYHHNDNAQLITGKFFDHGVVGKAIKGPICTHQYSGGVNMDYGGPVTLVATTVTHEMGHNFGMEHDNDTMCQCRDEKCIMAATSGQISPHYWSSCSQNALAEAFDLGMDYCLQNLPEEIYQGPVCGNGFKEEGEECDCGLPEDCSNRCCNPRTCNMFSSAQCATGMCCDLVTCKPKSAATMCRKPIGECDVPEYCDGQTEYCPEDYYIQDGHVCQHGESYCYNGTCKTHTNQCKLLWGESGRVSDPICFQQLNTNGDGDGSCAYNWTTNRYTRCDKEDVMCGLLHCVHLNEKLMFWKDNLALVMGANFLSRGNNLYVCRSAMLDVGLDMKDPGLVPDGAKCEENKICINQKCVSLAKLDIVECPNDCNGVGRCNSNNTCHCDIGYAPPLCDRPGYGGSIYSGPASMEIVVPRSTEGYSRVTDPNTRTVSTSILSTNNTSSDSGGTKVKKDLLIILLVVLVMLILLVLFILAYCNRGRLCHFLKGVPDIKYRMKGKSEKDRPPSLLDSSTGITGSESSNSSGGNPPPYTPKPVIWNPVKTTVEKAPPKRPAVAPKRPSSSTKTSSDKSASNSKEQFSNLNVTFTSSQSDIGTLTNPVPPPPALTTTTTTTTTTSTPSNNIPNSPKSSNKSIVKRESIRGSKISEPVLMSTTNRNSVVLADMQVSIIGPEADRESSTDSPNQRQRSVAANHNPVKRSFSDRQAARPHLLKQLPVSHLGGSGNLQKSESLKDTSPVAEEEKELIYANDMDFGNLLQDIDKELKGDNVYYNVSKNDPFEGAVLEMEHPAQPPRKMSQPNTSNCLESTTAKPSNDTAATLVLSNTNHASNKNIDNVKHLNASSPNSVHKNNKSSMSRSINNPIDELKKSLQTKNKSPASPKKSTTHNSPAISPANIANKPTPKNNTTSSISNPSKPTVVSRTNNLKNGTNPTKNTKTDLDSTKSSKPQSDRTNSTTDDSNNKKSNVSNLAARFHQGADETEKKSSSGAVKPLLRRNQTITGMTPNTKDKPDISPKPVPPPKPGNSGEGSPSPRPSAAPGIKRVHSYRI